MNPVSVQVVAAALGITTRRVQQLAKEGMPQLARGEYDLGACVAWYVAGREAAAKQEAAPTTLEEAKLRLINAQADKAELEHQVAQRQYLHIDDVEKLVRQPLERVRARLLSLPSKVAPQVPPVDTLAGARVLLEDAVREVLSELQAEAAVFEPEGIAA